MKKSEDNSGPGDCAATLPEAGMIAISLWCVVAAAVLLVSLAVHVFTFFAFDPIESLRGVMFIHVAIFPPFIAAIYYGRKAAGKDKTAQTRIMKSAPRWLRILTGVFFAYALVNFAAFLILNEGGGPYKQDGKYVLSSHGRVLREITEAEYHRQRAYEVRGFSGHWMLFASAALMFLVGARNARRAEVVLGALPADEPAVSPEASPIDPYLPPEPTTAKAGLISLVTYVGCLAMIPLGRPVLSVICLPPLMIGMVLALRRRHGFPRRPFESTLGCLCVVPNFFLSVYMGRQVIEFIYIGIYVGWRAAVAGDISVIFPRGGPSQLSTGEPLHNAAWSALAFFVQFPLVIVGVVGLTYFAEQVGRRLQQRRRTPDNG